MLADQRLLSRRFAILAVSVLVGLTGGCDRIGEIFSGAGLTAPDATFTGAEVRNISADAAEIDLNVRIDNPYPVPLPVSDLSYQLAAFDEPFASGEAFIGGQVPAGGAREITLPVTVRFRELLGVLTAVRPGQVVPYTADMALMVTGRENQQLRLPVRASGQLPVPAVPRVQVEAVDLRELSLDRAAGTVSLLVDNRNQFPLTLRTLRYDLSLAGVSVADSAVQPGTRFAPGESHAVQIPLLFRPSAVGRAVLQALRGGQAGYEVEGTMRLTSPYGPLEMGFSDSGEAPVSVTR